MTAEGAWTFVRPTQLQATMPPELRGVERDGVRLMLTRGEVVEHHHFRDLSRLLDPGDLLVVNRSATLRASLPAEARFGRFRLNLSTYYGHGVWLAEPRWDFDRPGPLPLPEGERFAVAGLSGRVIASYPSIERLVFVRFDGEVTTVMAQVGEPIRYGYVPQQYPFPDYQTIFASVPGSAEMPSAGRPFTAGLLQALDQRGVKIASVLLHTGVSSLEVGDAANGVPIYPEPFEVPAAAVAAIHRTRTSGRRVIAVGTTVVRALESAYDDSGALRPTRGFTQAYLHPGRPLRSVDGLITGWHEPGSTHLALLTALAGEPALRRAYAAAVDAGYLWHEFGDSHLLLHR